ncbi:uncharacterized protein [Spinacia oleracea]|uniref:Uncharacterized protein n=1 Tax=Spinacia oleracea TaxID=3562 RepID=A0ABM3R213_SPIOL|nr:uncharacterized protein LOC130464226 [Spinacia oleracea]
MERNDQRGGSLSSRGLEESKGEHIIHMHDLEACLLRPQETEEHHSPLLSQFQTPQLPNTPPRRRLHPNNPNLDTNPTTLPPSCNPHPHHQHLGFRFRRLFGSPRLLHACPIIVILCVILLWWFSSPVNLAIKDGRFIEHSSNLWPFALNETDLTLSRQTVLAVATSPNPNIELIMSMVDKAASS